ncbi:unnamed protein product [Moneuplotes crassus]|uniref:Uncharacterized protein n=1 Tax=Euplotes crassus TaxID=5936 RepID=A0AAD1Y9Y8_EUPCR|nr:unnamed protein product [Moneuplotes crassus]
MRRTNLVVLVAIMVVAVACYPTVTTTNDEHQSLEFAFMPPQGENFPHGTISYQMRGPHFYPNYDLGFGGVCALMDDLSDFKNGTSYPAFSMETYCDNEPTCSHNDTTGLSILVTLGEMNTTDDRIDYFAYNVTEYTNFTYSMTGTGAERDPLVMTISLTLNTTSYDGHNMPYDHQYLSCFSQPDPRTYISFQWGLEDLAHKNLIPANTRA